LKKPGALKLRVTTEFCLYSPALTYSLCFSGGMLLSNWKYGTVTTLSHCLARKKSRSSVLAVLGAAAQVAFEKAKIEKPGRHLIA
jgi:hypothetical protein